MDDPAKNGSFVFIVGSPRSGTTIFGELLDKHPQLSQWYEPYFVWDRFFRKEIYSILTPQLLELGYTGSEEWLNQN
jgi:hypothetical protein